jgi:hypothetical protein
LFIAGCEAYNLGTGKGTSVLEIVNAFEKASGKVWLDFWLALNGFMVGMWCHDEMHVLFFPYGLIS